jgi:hypothetical protein
MKGKRNKKDENKRKLPSFSLRSKMKQIRSEICFRFDASKVFFCLFSCLKRNENEMKQKYEKEAKIQSKTRMK